jgi:hypothetical protein
MHLVLSLKPERKGESVSERERPPHKLLQLPNTSLARMFILSVYSSYLRPDHKKQHSDLAVCSLRPKALWFGSKLKQGSCSSWEGGNVCVCPATGVESPEDLGILHSNRAACYLKDGNSADCIQDCTRYRPTAPSLLTESSRCGLGNTVTKLSSTCF